MRLYKINKIFLFYKLWFGQCKYMFFYFQFYNPFLKIGHKKYVHFLFFDLRIVKKNEKITLEHNGVIYNIEI